MYVDDVSVEPVISVHINLDDGSWRYKEIFLMCHYASNKARSTKSHIIIRFISFSVWCQVQIIRTPCIIELNKTIHPNADIDLQEFIHYNHDEIFYPQKHFNN